MTDDRFHYLCIWSDRIESEVYRRSTEIFQLSEEDFRTIPEARLDEAQRRLRSTADYIAKKLDEMRAARVRNAA